MSHTEVKESQPAPDFTLPAIGSDDVVKDGKVQLSALRNHVVVLYFYPRDDTPGCTAEACSFRDANREMQKRGIIVLGVSADSIESHQKFAEVSAAGGYRYNRFAAVWRLERKELCWQNLYGYQS